MTFLKTTCVSVGQVDVNSDAAYQHVDSAAHAVLRTSILRDGSVRQKVLQQAAQQQSQLLSRLGQVSVASAVLQQSVQRHSPHKQQL